MDSGYIVLILFTLLVGILFHQAWQGHSESILTGFFAVLGGILVAWVFYHFLAPLLDSRVGVMSLKQRILSSGVLGLGGWAALRGPAATFSAWLHQPGNPLHFCSDGFAAGLVSLLPGLVLVFLLSLCLRWAGTVLELRNYQTICHPNAYFPAATYPHWSGMTVWRDGWESLPGVEGVCNLVAGTARKRHRNLAALVIASSKKPFFHQLGEDPETAPLLNNAAFQGLLEDPGILALREARDSLGLIASPRLQAASLDRELKVLLTVVNLRNAADRFFLSDHWQGTVKQEKVANQVIRAAEKENGR